MKIIDECIDAPLKSHWGMFTTQMHEWTTEKIGVHMVGESDTFKVHRRCRYCGKIKIEHFVEYETLRDEGHTKEELALALKTPI